MGNEKRRARRPASFPFHAAEFLVTFADVVPVPFRNVHGHITLHDGLAAKAGVQLEIRSLFDPVHFIFFHLRQVIDAFLCNHMTGGAGAASATGMLQVEAEVHRHIEQGTRLPMFFIGQFTFFILERHVSGEESYLGHSFNCSGPHIIAR